MEGVCSRVLVALGRGNAPWGRHYDVPLVPHLECIDVREFRSPKIAQAKQPVTSALRLIRRYKAQIRARVVVGDQGLPTK